MIRVTTLRDAWRRVLTTVESHRLCSVMVAIAVVVRVAFWRYTHRQWEDSLVTITTARNFWEGNGLTHHVSEPRVQSFSSPASLFVAIIGEAFHRGLLFLRVASIVAGAVSVVCAYRIGRLWSWPRSVMLLVLGFIAVDQLQVFFGMVGMETQMATAVLLGGVYALFAGRLTLLGVMLGLAGLCRPEFALWIVLVGASVLWVERRRAVRTVVIASALIVPWFAFTAWYYGSPIPHTIVAKNLYPWVSNRSSEAMEDQLGVLWKTLAPFRSFQFTVSTPFPNFVLQATAAVVICLALYGAFVAAQRRLIDAVPAAFVLAFYAYEVVALVPAYFMWYIPPIAATVFVYVGIGTAELLRHRRPWRRTLSVALLGLYAAHIPFTYPIERSVQRDVEQAVRTNIGRYLDEHMTASDTVVLEPIGFVGYTAFNKTVYDYPGLGSLIVTDDLARHIVRDRNMIQLIADLRPTYVALRPNEWDALLQVFPDIAATYTVEAEFTSPPTLQLENGGVRYFNVDTRFVVARRMDG